MGVPKFFRYISERYACLSELAREQSIPEFDNMYLDMNGIIHNCSHPDDNNIHFNITEENMFKDIFNYIDKLFFLIKPRKLFFMAIDGVAPRAKMNQQRSRRFRSAKDAEDLEIKALQRGEIVTHERFDSNCITPGTEFMARLHNALRYFVKSKFSSDPLWQNVRVILSGHNSPGEGEHKIMDYIRFLKSQKGYDPTTRHCLYGLDADLIILGMCTHELHFVVLREEVKFGRNEKRKSVEETRFFLLHLSLLRDYLELEFDELRKNYESFDIDKLVDDWVLMGFLVGNDFVPHLPCLHISSNALPLLYKTYTKVYPNLGGNINENGKLNLERLEIFFEALSEVELQEFEANSADLKYFQPKLSKNGVDETFDFDVNEIRDSNKDEDLARLIMESNEFMDDNDTSDEEQHLADEFETYKKNYYLNKMKKDVTSELARREQAIGYVTALQWILDYYYRGVQSWDWYYPHHYAPFISDLKNFKNHKITFNMGQPFLPFEQLLAVLPAASRKLLPAAYRDLMIKEDSELIHFYPTEFETDLNGKKNDWEAVVLIPFIDEKLLLQAMSKCETGLSAEERERNKHGPMYQYIHTQNSQGSAPGIFSMKAIYNVFCTETPLWSSDIIVPYKNLNTSVMPKEIRSVFYPGFPTMKHLDYDFELKFARVKVFEQPSRNETMILKPKNRDGFDSLEFMKKYIGKVVYIGWPHLTKARVVAICNDKRIVDRDGEKGMDFKEFNMYVRDAQNQLMERMGIELNDYSVMVQVEIHTGIRNECAERGEIKTIDTWGLTRTTYPAEALITEIIVHEPLKNHNQKIEHFFPVNTKIFLINNSYFGCEGTVLDPMLVYDCGRILVSLSVLPEPDFTEAKNTQKLVEREYISMQEVSSIIGVSVKCVGQLTGMVLVVPGNKRSDIEDNAQKVNIGLQVKFPRQQEERAGYARRIGNNFYYSIKTVELLQSYWKEFPSVFEYISNSYGRSDYIFESELFSGETGRLDELAAWLKRQEHMNAEKISCGTELVEKETVEKILVAVEELKNLLIRTLKVQVKPHFLLKPDADSPIARSSKNTPRLFDRAVVVRTTYGVPVGAKGTVIGISPVCDPNPVRLECVKKVEYFLEILFDTHLPNGNDIYGIASQRVYKVPESSVLLIYRQDKQTMKTFKAANSVSSESAETSRDTIDNEFSATTIKSFEGESKKKTILASAKGGKDFWLPSPAVVHKNCTINMLLKPDNKNDISVHTNKKIKEEPIEKLSAIPKSSSNQKPNYFLFPDPGKKKLHFHNSLDTETPVMKKPLHEIPSFKTNLNERQSTSTQQLHNSTNVKWQTGHSQPLIHNDGKFFPKPPMFHPAMISTPTDTNAMNDALKLQAETQALKSLLGMNLNVNTNNCDSSIRMPNMQLPQPPPRWRSDAQNNKFSQLGGYVKQFNPNPIGPIQPQPQFLKPTNPSRPMRSQNAPMQPSLTSPFENAFNPGSLNHKGAFIPLQAWRKQISNLKSANADGPPVDITQEEKKVEQISFDASSKLHARTLSDDKSKAITHARAKAVMHKKPAKPSKIACNFTNN